MTPPAPHPTMYDKRKIRLILPCEEYGICWLKGAHIFDEKFIIEFLNNHKYFKGDDSITVIDIESHGYCRKMYEKDCDNPSEWVCEGKYAWYDCPKDAKGAVPYTQVYFHQDYPDEVRP